MTSLSASISVQLNGWAVPCLAASAVIAAVLLVFDALVLVQAVRARRDTHRRLLLGQSLLAGLLACCGGAAASALEPGPLSCSVGRLMVGAGAAVVYASLLVKCVLLHSQHSGVHLPSSYQALLLAALTAVQLVLELQTLVLRPPRHQQDEHCSTSFRQQAAALVYPFLLLTTVTAAALRARHVRENGREAVFIAATGLLSGVVWAGWLAVGFLAVSPKETALSIALLLNTGIVFLVMFLSKSRQLVAVGRHRKSGDHGNNAEDDRDDSFCYGDTSPYSPSFYHFRPVKVQPADVWRKHPLLHPAQLVTPYVIPRCSGYMRQEDNVYNSVEQLQYKRPAVPDHNHPSNSNVFFYRPPYSSGMMY